MMIISQAVYNNTDTIWSPARFSV